MGKSRDAFRTISEAAAELDLPQHVLRHWEDSFGAIRPMRRAGGRRYYRLQDIELLNGVKVLLHGQGFTTKGVQKIFSEQGASYVSALGRRDLEGQVILEKTPLADGLVTFDRDRLKGLIDRAEALKKEITALRQELGA